MELIGKLSLDSLEYFSVASGALVPDIMHDILEGALPYEIKLMLKMSVFNLSLLASETSTHLHVGFHCGQKTFHD